MPSLQQRWPNRYRPTPARGDDETHGSSGAGAAPYRWLLRDRYRAASFNGSATSKGRLLPTTDVGWVLAFNRSQLTAAVDRSSGGIRPWGWMSRCGRDCQLG